MAALSGTLVASRIVPSDSLDTYATHDAEWGRDGHRSVATITDRDAITDQRRKEGMTVWVQAEAKQYRLIGGIANSNWVEDSGSTTNISDIPVTDLEMTDYFVIIRDAATYKAKVEDLRCKLINEYIFTTYPENVVFVGECPVFINDTIIEVS